MDNAFVMRLGSGSTSRHGVGSKGKLLDTAARAGLPVPRSVLVLDAMTDLAVLHGAAAQSDGKLTVVDAGKLAVLLGLPELGPAVAVRSAFSHEDGDDSALAGYFRTVLNVTASDSVAIGKAIEAVWASASGMPETGESGAFVRRDILVMEMVAATHSGVAFTEREYEDDLINYTAGTAERLLGGQITGDAMSLPKLRGWEKFSLPDDLPAWAARLQALLRDVRRWIGGHDWDVEWADDGKTCWLLQLRPITRPTMRDEVFSIANHKEILPPLPSPFMTSVVESCAFDLYGYYRDFDPSLPKNRPFLEVFYGRPYINLSLMAETMRHWGLPTRLITDNIGGAAGQPVGLNIRRVLTKTLGLTLVKQALAQILSVRRARQASLDLDARLSVLGETLPEQVQEARALYIALVRQMFALLAASGPMVSLLARVGVLSELNAYQETISTRKFRQQEAIRAYVAQNPALRLLLRAGNLPTDAGFIVLWEAYLQEFGHRGIFESDLSRPRDSEAPAELLRSLANLPREIIPKPRRRILAWLMWPLWLQASRTIQAREQWRHDMMRGFAAVRAGLIHAADAFVNSGALPDIDHLWLLHTEEIAALAEGWCPNATFWHTRKEEVAALESVNPPDLLNRYQNENRTENEPSEDTLAGIPLTRGTVSGRAWVLHEPASMLPEGFTRESTILIARSVDVGWVATFGLVAGVIVQTGGHLSHGSIVLREIGLPAVTNLADATNKISTGDSIILDAARGIAQIIPFTGE